MKHLERKYKPSNAVCKTFAYFDKSGKRVYKNKIQYNTEKEALEKAFEINLEKTQIRKVAAYKCKVCGKWHLGRTIKYIDDLERERILKKKEKFEILNR